MNLLLMMSSLQEHFLHMFQASFTLLIPLLSFVLQEPILQIDTKVFVYGPAHLNKY